MSTGGANRTILLCVACLGVSSVVTQILTLREFLNVFSGNELVLGLILGNWLLLTGAGSFLGRYASRINNPLPWLMIAQGGIAVAPPVQLWGIRFIKQIYPPGLMLGMGEAFLSSFVILLPFCLLSGFLLTFFSGLASSRRDDRQIGEVYVMDTLGSIAGGLLFSLWLIHFFTPFQVVTFLLLLNLVAVGMVAYTERKPFPGLLVTGILVLAVVVLRWSDPEHSTMEYMFPGQEVVQQRSTPYGNITVTRSGRQLNIYTNSVPVAVTDDPIAAEEMVHYTLAQDIQPRQILLVSGSLNGATREAAKYPVERIDCVEMDPAVIDLALRIGVSRNDPRLRLIADDARRFIKSAHNRYDAILVDIPDPATAQLNRFYTSEFFTEVYRALRPGGVLSVSLKGAENYANPQLRRLASSVHHSLKSVFPEILVIPGTKMVLLASERPLDYRISDRLRNRGIRTSFVNANYLKAMLTEDRIAAAEQVVSERTALNKDFHPSAYYAHLQYWLSRVGATMWLPGLLVVGIVIAILALLAVSKNRAVSAALSGSGFAGMGLEVVLLIAFQVCYGYVYEQLALIVTAFLLGAAAGALWSRNKGDRAREVFFRLDALFAVSAFLMAPLLVGIDRFWEMWNHPAIPAVMFALLTGWVGFLAGGQFPLAAKLVFREVEKTAGHLYAVDLLGACLGAILITAFSIPILGITTTCYLIGGIKLASALALRFENFSTASESREATSAPAYGRWSALGLVLLGFVSIGVIIVGEDTSTSIYGLSFEPAYHGILLAFMGWGVLQAMGLKSLSGRKGVFDKGILRFSRAISDRTRIGPFRWLSYLAFGLAIFYPIFRCFFKIPYLFCHVCPRKCVFGYLRPYLVPAALIMNLENRHWCYHVCPIGTLHQCQPSAPRRVRRLPHFLTVLSWIVLALIPVAYFKIKWDYENQPAAPHDWYTTLFNNSYTVSWVVIVVACLIILLGFFWRRTFCGALCPVGSLSQLILKIPGTRNRTDSLERLGRVNFRNLEPNKNPDHSRMTEDHLMRKEERCEKDRS